jgi:hypothetical protein
LLACFLSFLAGRLLASPNLLLQLDHESQPTIEEITQISDRSSMLGHSNEVHTCMCAHTKFYSSSAQFIELCVKLR